MALLDRALSVRFADIGAVSSNYVTSPVSGRIVKIWGAVDTTTATAATIITPAIAPPGSNAFVATGNTMSIPAGTLPGQSVEFAPSSPNYILAGGTLRLASDGGTTSSGAGYFTVLVREGGG